MASKSFPTGSILPFPNNHGDSIPNGWILCDGSSVNRNQYSELYSLIGTTYGSGDSSEEFNIPDLQEWFVKGVDTSSMRDVNSGAGNVNNSSVNFGQASYQYDLQLTIGDSEYTDSEDQIESSAFQGSGVSDESGEHSHEYTVSTEQAPFGCGIGGDILSQQCLDNMNPKHIFASQMSVPVGTTISDEHKVQMGKIYNRFGEATIADTSNFFGFHKSDGTSDFKDEDNHKWTHSGRANLYTYHCYGMYQNSRQRQESFGYVYIGVNDGGAKATNNMFMDAYHQHVIAEEFQVQAGETVHNMGTSNSYQYRFASKRLFTPVDRHNHGSLTLELLNSDGQIVEESNDSSNGVFHGSNEHQVDLSVNSSIVVADDPETGESYSGPETLPKAIVMAFIIKT